MGAEHELKAEPLEHENQQVGYLIECPSCTARIVVPIAEFLDRGTWTVPPQNTEMAARGWHYAWGTEAAPSGLHLRQSMATPHSDHQPGADDVITCASRGWLPSGEIVNVGCGRSYRVIAGALVDAE